jgi:hypothetical protein
MGGGCRSRGINGFTGEPKEIVSTRSAAGRSDVYRRILIAVENSGADRTIVDHVSELARLTGAELLLVHVADGWAARNFDQLKLRESEEMRTDRAYLDMLRAELTRQRLYRRHLPRDGPTRRRS